MKAVDTAVDPVSRFAMRLMEAPALRSLPALQKEEQALNVLRANGPQLVPVFTSLGMAVSRGWQEPAALVAKAIRSAADRMTEAEISELISSRLALSFFPALAGGRPAPARAREELQGLVGRTARHPVARSALSGSLAAAHSDIIDKYIPRALERKKYVYVEISRVQRLPLPPDQLADLLRFMLLVRPAAYLFVTPGQAPDREAGYAPLQEQYLSKILPGLGSSVPSVPHAILALGLRCTLAWQEDSTNVEATARLGAVMALRGRALAPSVTVDRGADTPDKSWFNVQRKNARWRGLDAKMLDELYTIASENGW
jgi:hypothetical protein